MMKRTFQWIVIGALLVSSFAITDSAIAGGSSCATYAVVQWGDTLSSLAALCGTTVQAIQAANPGLGGWLFAGQVIYIPSGNAPTTPYAGQVAGSTYTVQWGDSLGGIAQSNGFTVSQILAVNPQIWNANVIFPGQVINLPASSYTPSSTVSPQPYSILGIPAGYDILKVTNKKGLNIRTGPRADLPTIQSPTASAVYQSAWLYRKNSITVDGLGFVWAEISFDHPVNGYSTGWIMVKDGLGTYYTNPKIDP
jgi:LysM repeat protein